MLKWFFNLFKGQAEQQKSQLKAKTLEIESEEYYPVDDKIIENENDYTHIDAFDEKFEAMQLELKERFGANPSKNDVLWGVLQNNIEHIDFYSTINRHFKYGLISFKEKRFKDSVANLIACFHMLQQHYPDKPVEPDSFWSETEPDMPIKNAYHKVINKIQRAIEKGELNTEDFEASAVRAVSFVYSETPMDQSLSKLKKFIDFNIKKPKKDELSIEIFPLSIDVTPYGFKDARKVLRKQILHYIQTKEYEQVRNKQQKLYCLAKLGQYCYGHHSMKTAVAGWACDAADIIQKKFDCSKHSFEKDGRIDYTVAPNDIWQFYEEILKDDALKVIHHGNLERLKELYASHYEDSEDFLSEADYKRMDKYLQV